MSRKKNQLKKLKRVYSMRNQSEKWREGKMTKKKM